MTDSPPERRTTILLATAALAIAVVVFIVLIWFLPWWLTILLALVIGGGVVAWVHRSADNIVLRKVGATAAVPGAHERLENLADGLCVANGFHRPSLYVIDDGALNALAVGRTPQTAAVAVTTGLIDTLTTIELEGVLAHELSKIRSKDTLLATNVAVFVGLPLGAFGGLASKLGQQFLGAQRSVRADMAGVQMTRYPPGLQAALAKMHQDGRQLKTSPVATRHLWINMPDGSLVPAEFALEDRIALLQEL